jgi:hypothetical protein
MFISFCLSLFIFGSAFCPKCCWCFRQPFLADIADPVALANLLNQKVRDFKNGGPTAVVPSGAPSDVEMAR